MSEKQELLNRVQSLEEAEEDWYTELGIQEVVRITDAAALIKFNLNEFIAGRNLIHPIWFPLSLIRKVDDALWFKSSLAREKGLDARR